MPKFSVKKPLTIFVSVVLIIVLGIVSFIKMTPDLLPSIDMPYVVVMTTYPGASPEKVQTEVTKPLEQSLATLDNIKNVQSMSGENFSVVFLEFTNDVNMDTVSVDIMSNIDLIKGAWNENVSSPFILKMNPNMIPVLVAAVSYEGKDTKELSQFVKDEILDKLTGTTGVAKVDASGLIETTINVTISQEKIDRLNNRLLGKVNGALADAQIKLLDGQKQLDKAKSELNQKKNDLNNAKDGAYDQLAQGKAELNAGIAQVSALNTQIQLLEGNVTALEQQLAMARRGQLLGANIINITAQLETDRAMLSALKESLGDANSQLAQLKAAYAQAEKGSYTAIEQFSNFGQQLQAGEKQLLESQKALDEGKKQMRTSAKEALDKANVSGYITMDTVSGILKAQNFNMPAGYVASGEDKVLVSVGDEISSIAQTKNLPLFNVDGIGEIKLKDVADVALIDNSKEVYGNINGHSGVLLTFNKQSNFATTVSAKNIQDKFESLQDKYPGLEFTTLMSQGDYIYIIINSILSSLAWGALFAILILLLFLRNIRPTIITILSIPISLTFAIVLMYFTGVTINMMSLSGLAISVGMLVDNSVVVMENTFRLRRQGVPPHKAAVAGAKQVAMAITSSTLTTICVFLPLVFTDGMVRSLAQDMALTLCYALFASLFIALTLVPSMSSLMLTGPVKEDSEKFVNVVEKYKKAVAWGLDHKKSVLGGALIALALCLGISLAKGFIFIPNMSTPMLSGSIQTDEEATLEDTMAVSDEVIDRIMKVDGVVDCGGMLASSSNFGIDLGSGQESHVVTLYLLLDEHTSRSNDEIGEDIRNACKGLDCTVDIVTSSSITEYTSALGGEGIGLKLYSEDQHKLQDAAKLVSKGLKDLEGVKEVDDGIQDLDKEYHLAVDKAKAAKHGLTVAQVYMAVADKLNGTTNATTISWEGSNYQINVEKADKDKVSIDDVLNTEVTGETGKAKVKDVAKVEDTTSLGSIQRHNQKTYLPINAKLKDGYNVTLVADKARDMMDKIEMPKGVTFEFDGENETIMDAMKQLLEMFLLGIVLVYGIMACQFQSLKSPFIIIFTIPLAITGGLLGLILTGKEISAVAMLGFIMLAGIIVNNGIVLVDYINQLRASGLSKRDAIIQGGVTRIRPILMTTLTTVFGLIVMAIGKTAGTDTMQPIAIVCIGGLLYATLLTLFVIPCIYDILNKEEFKQLTEEDLDIAGII
ncbi:MAG: efflux RND transporter permease subunit [Clostridia bacterium]|nr:efflux RND transporter permease subunit [Clostridia bacterium]